MAKFKIGDRVKSRGGYIGEVRDSLFSTNADSWFYEVQYDTTGGGGTFKEEYLAPAPKSKDYRMQIQVDIANNVVIATLLEVEDPNMRTIAKGHGHLIHEGELGIAQAASYACKRLYESLGGTINKGGNLR